VLQNVSQCQLHVHIFGVASFAHDVKPGLWFVCLIRWFKAGKCSIIILRSVFLFMLMDVLFTSM